MCVLAGAQIDADRPRRGCADPIDRLSHPVGFQDLPRLGVDIVGTQAPALTRANALAWCPGSRASPHAVIVSVLLRSCSARAPERVVRARSARARASWNRRAGMGMGMAAMLSSMARLQQHGGMVASRLFTVELQRQSADAVPCGAWSAWLASCLSWVLCCCSQSSWR